MTKLFTHDCDSCQYLYTDTRKKVDWYVCPTSLGSAKGSIIGRYGNDGPEYWSSPVDVILNAGSDSPSDFMTTAYRIARSLGHVEGSKLTAKLHPEDGCYLCLDDVIPELLAWSNLELPDGRIIGIGRNRQGVQAIHFP